MKTYRITFKVLSSITHLPDAQTLFGSFCNIIRSTQGEEALQQYFQSFQTQPLFIHSSMFPHELLPMVKVGLISIQEKNDIIFNKEKPLSPKQQLHYLSYMKEFKKINYTTPFIYKNYIAKARFTDLKKALLDGKVYLDSGILSEKEMSAQRSDTELIFHAANLSDNNREDERGLYFDRNLYFQAGELFDVYVKTDNIEYVKDIMKYAPYFGFGNRISVGKNSFEMVEVKEFNIAIPQSDDVILLSKCISEDFDFDESSYIMESNSYKGSSYYSSNTIGTFTKLVEGSFMRVKAHKEYYGSLIKTDNGKTIYHYAIGFVF